MNTLNNGLNLVDLLEDMDNNELELTAVDLSDDVVAELIGA
jgi:hypothetical protein